MNPNPRIQKYCDKVLERLPNRREYQPDVDCCKWREKIEELLGKKKKKAKPKKKKKNDDPSCCKKKDEILDKRAKLAACCKTKKKKKVRKERKKMAKMENCRDILNRLYACVQPSIAVRDQLMSGRHILCMLDDLETVEYCKLKELRKKCDEDPTLPPDCQPLEEGEKCEPQEVVARRASSTSDGKKCCKLITGISRKCIYKKTTRTSRKPKEPRDDCDCFRYNFSRCSLDSDVDVEEFKLTEEEIKKIEKNRKKAVSKGNDFGSSTNHSMHSSIEMNDVTKDTISELGNEVSLEHDE